MHIYPVIMFPCTIQIKRGEWEKNKNEENEKRDEDEGYGNLLLFIEMKVY